MTLAVVLAIPAIALADAINGDADADALDSPHANSSSNQQSGTTVNYNFDAYIRELGSSADNVFVNTGDNVKVSIARSGDWLASPAGTPDNMTFTKYTSNTAVSGSTNDNTQSGNIAVKVPCGTAAGTQKTMTVTLTGTAYDDGVDNTVGTADDVPLPSGRQLSGTRSLTFTYVITAQGSDAASCNHAPTVSTDAGNVSGNEGSELTNSGDFSDEDTTDTLTITKLSGAGTVTPSTTTRGAWSWSHTPDDNGTGTGQVQVSDGKGGTAVDSFTWTAANVAPTATKASILQSTRAALSTWR
jgi:hypothetical protein